MNPALGMHCSCDLSPCGRRRRAIREDGHNCTNRRTQRNGANQIHNSSPRDGFSNPVVVRERLHRRVERGLKACQVILRNSVCQHSLQHVVNRSSVALRAHFRALTGESGASAERDALRRSRARSACFLAVASLHPIAAPMSAYDKSSSDRSRIAIAWFRESWSMAQSIRFNSSSGMATSACAAPRDSRSSFVALVSQRRNRFRLRNRSMAASCAILNTSAAGFVCRCTLDHRRQTVASASCSASSASSGSRRIRQTMRIRRSRSGSTSSRKPSC